MTVPTKTADTTQILDALTKVFHELEAKLRNQQQGLPQSQEVLAAIEAFKDILERLALKVRQ